MSTLRLTSTNTRDVPSAEHLEARVRRHGPVDHRRRPGALLLPHSPARCRTQRLGLLARSAEPPPPAVARTRERGSALAPGAGASSSPSRRRRGRGGGRGRRVLCRCAPSERKADEHTQDCERAVPHRWITPRPASSGQRVVAWRSMTQPTSFRRTWLVPMATLASIAVVTFGCLYTVDHFLTGWPGRRRAGDTLRRYFFFDQDHITDAVSSPRRHDRRRARHRHQRRRRIVVQLSAERYTGVAQMFFRDRTNIGGHGVLRRRLRVRRHGQLSIRADFVPRARCSR